jgi:transcription elongation factor/antiterminator RfaH
LNSMGYKMDPAGEKFPWYALQVWSRRESIIASHLEGQGLECFLPIYKCKRQWSDRKKELDQPLFPGYLFCRFDLQNRRPVLMVPGVQQIVGIGRTPMPVEDGELDSIRQALASGLKNEPCPYFAIGERVRVNYGSMVDLEGILTNFKGSNRVVLSVTLLQRSVAMEVDLAWVTPAPETKTVAEVPAYNGRNSAVAVCER